MFPALVGRREPPPTLLALKRLRLTLVALLLSLGSAAGWSSLVARRAHNPKVAGSNPAPAIRERSVISVTGRLCICALYVLISHRATVPQSVLPHSSNPFSRGARGGRGEEQRLLQLRSRDAVSKAFCSCAASHPPRAPRETIFWNDVVAADLCCSAALRETSGSVYGRTSASVTSTSKTRTLLGGMMMLPAWSRTVEYW